MHGVQAQTWAPWLDTIPEFKCDPTKPFSQIIVPTVDTVRYTHVVDALLAGGKHVLCVGETGTGKTLTLMTKLLEGMPAEVQPLFLTFSARTSANQTQDTIGKQPWSISFAAFSSVRDLICSAACHDCLSGCRHKPLGKVACMHIRWHQSCTPVCESASTSSPIRPIWH